MARRIHLERQRALAHAEMMMVGAMGATALMMLGLAALTLVQ